MIYSRVCAVGGRGGRRRVVGGRDQTRMEAVWGLVVAVPVRRPDPTLASTSKCKASVDVVVNFLCLLK